MLQNKQLLLKFICKHRRECFQSVSPLPVLHRLQSAAGQVGVEQVAEDLDVGHWSPVHLRQGGDHLSIGPEGLGAGGDEVDGESEDAQLQDAHVKLAQVLP